MANSLRHRFMFLARRYEAVLYARIRFGRGSTFTAQRDRYTDISGNFQLYFVSLPYGAGAADKLEYLTVMAIYFMD